MYAYLGTFSRYIADDYCETTQFQNRSLIGGVADRYMSGAWRAASRYSNLLFVGLGDLLGDNSLPVIITGMILLWAGGLSWCLHELRRITGIRWNTLLDVHFGLMLAFFSLWLAPNLFQTIYWRSAMMTHFAPLVFGTFLFAFILWQARLSETKPISPLAYVSITFASFIFAGFSEPPTTTALTVLSIILSAIWLWAPVTGKFRKLALFGWSFVGIIIGFMVMLFSPAVSAVVNEKNPEIGLILFTSFEYAFFFMRDSLLSRLLPFSLVFVLPFATIWSWRQWTESAQPERTTNERWWLFLLFPLLTWLLIAAGFAPSVFGQSFPVERMRFLANSFIIVTILIMGGWLGMRLPLFRSKAAKWVVLLLFAAISSIYSLRAAYSLSVVYLPEYKYRAELWDLRNEYILDKVSQGEMTLVIPGLSGYNGVKEIDADPVHWINVCAAQFYGVSTIEAFSVEEEELMEYLLNE